MTGYLHFSLGPVQGFVAQARRTRDFWAGSFLLSWLTAHAMKAVVDRGGRIVMPAVDQDGMLERVRSQSGMGPQFGSLPNQFVAEVPDGIDGSLVVEGVLCAWKALADAVWERDRLQQAGVDRVLWESQVGGFWEIYWVLAPDDDGRHLAMRKNWRSHMPPTSEGDKCTMMGEWQELSGA
ncbi:type III-B CRISPR-associated protein Cas10/Cmr2, partial [Candidatus Parcubacteria bacterium]